MAVSNLLTTLIERLLDLTTEGKIKWEETADENVFLASVSHNVVTIGRRRSPEDYDSWDYEIQVSDRQGRLVDETSSSDTSVTAEGGNPYVDLARLFEAARRKALDTDKVLAELISSLDSIGHSK
ncbi:conserved hypothetical protein [Candidatus Sulfopaludibacter sp. SbA4]|nr:conserved hypothetical protein [Candidatus Sulfopaludibacter sp. SbA4]